MYTIAINGEKW